MASSSSSSSSTKVTMKLLIDTKNQKVLFAEASKPVIDFLFNLLRLPVGTVVRLLNTSGGMVGSLGNLYQSVENLSLSYMQPEQDKDPLLNPKAPMAPPEIAGLLPANDDRDTTVGGSSYSFFMCPNNRDRNVTCDSTTLCPQCREAMNVPANYVGKKVEDIDLQGTGPITNGFVKEVVTYMVMDDLVVEPMSTISCIALLNKFNVSEVGVLQEKVVEWGMAEGVRLLKASLQSKMVLTSVFLNKNMK